MTKIPTHTLKLVFGMLIVAVSLFITAGPANAQTFTFGAAGDFANGSNFQATVNQAASNNLNFFVGLGDFSYTPGAESSWCGKWNSTFSNILLITGNHDVGEGTGGNINTYIQHCSYRPAGMNGNYGHQYYFDYPTNSPTARFILIRPGLSNLGAISYNSGGAGYTYVSNAIDEARARGIKWIIVGMHKNYISAMEKPNELGPDLVNMLISKRVDVVLQGHEHGYERSKQLSCATTNSYNPACVADSDNNMIQGAGTIIHVIGTGGQGLRGLNTGDSEYPYFAATDVTTYGFGRFTVSPTQLGFTFVRSAGGNFSDSFTINASGSTATPAPTTPPTPAPTAPPTTPPTPSPSVAPSPTPVPSPSSCAAIPTTLGTVTSQVTVPNTEVYSLWSRMMSGDTFNNSYYLQVDSNCPIEVRASGSANTWIWGQPVNVTLNQGAHQIRLIGKNSATKIDKVMVVNNGCTPSGSGDNCAGAGGAKPGDANNDGKVDGLDYVVWLVNFGQSVSGPSTGDFNNDGRVDGLDYIFWLNNYGS